MVTTKVALVTGGTAGIGRAITTTLAERGFRVVAWGKDAEYARETEGLLTEKALAADIVDGDVADRTLVNAVVTRTVERYGRIDVLCNNAAIRMMGNVLETDEEQWDRMMAVNVKGAYLCTRAVLPYMIRQGGGVIINTASCSGYGGRNHLAYATAKGAIFPFTMSLALDHAKDHVRVNAVVPGFTLTGMTINTPPERLAESALDSVAGRVCQPQDVANAVAFLASDQAEQITGALLEVGAFHGQMVIPR